MYAISDIANEHLLRTNGNWYQKPISEDDLPLLVLIEDRKEAEAFCRAKIAEGCHCRPYGISA